MRGIQYAYSVTELTFLFFSAICTTLLTLNNVHKPVRNRYQPNSSKSRRRGQRSPATERSCLTSSSPALNSFESVMQVADHLIRSLISGPYYPRLVPRARFLFFARWAQRRGPNRRSSPVGNGGLDEIAADLAHIVAILQACLVAFEQVHVSEGTMQSVDRIGLTGVDRKLTDLHVKSLSALFAPLCALCAPHRMARASGRSRPTKLRAHSHWQAPALTQP